MAATYLAVRQSGPGVALAGPPLVHRGPAPIYDWSKLLLMQVFVLLGWRYIERLGTGRAGH